MSNAYKNLYIAAGLFLITAMSSQAASSVGLNFSYTNGNPNYYAPIYGQPVAGYGSTASAYGFMGGFCYGGGGYYNGGGVWGPGNPANPGLPATLPPVMPPAMPMMPSYPHMSGWGPGYASYPYPYPYAPNGGLCGIPCGAGMQPYPMYPVPGGPVVPGHGGVVDSGYSHRSGAQVYSVNGTTIVDLSASRGINEWEKNDNGEIVGAMAAGMVGMTTNVFPVAYPRNDPFFVPIMGNGQPSNPGQYPRPHYGYGH